MTRFTDAQQSAIARLVRGLPSRRVVCVGAAALTEHVPLSRVTHDVDLVISAGPEEIAPLVEALGFAPDPAAPHRFRDPDGTRVDLLPSDDATLARGHVEFERGRIMNVAGFDLAMKHRKVVELPRHDVRVDVAELAVIVVLKMISFLDRPNERQRDLEDLHSALKLALDADDDARWSDEMVESGVLHEHHGAYFVGRRVGTIVDERHLVSIHRFLSDAVDPGGRRYPEMLRAANLVAKDPAAYVADRFAAFCKGLDHVRS